jgi:hypothetical protein
MAIKPNKVKPVKVLTDLLTKKQIIKQDSDGNITFSVSGSVSGSGAITANLPLTGSEVVFDLLTIKQNNNFNLIPIITSSVTINSIEKSIYSVDQAFKAIDSVISTAESTRNAYTRLRYKHVGFFDEDGYAEIKLPQTNVNYFPTASYDFINVDVMVKDEDRWVNDIMSVNLFIYEEDIYVGVSAPNLGDTDQYRIIVNNENPDDYDLN